MLAIRDRPATRARDVMTADPPFVTPETPIGRAAATMRDAGTDALPVVFDGDGRRPIGIISDRDIAVRHAALDHGRSCAVWEHMTPGPLETVPAEAALEEVERRLYLAPSSRLLVVDPGGRLVGIITRAEMDRAARLGPPASPRPTEEEAP